VVPVVDPKISVGGGFKIVYTFLLKKNIANYYTQKKNQYIKVYRFR
jgi:hypothetical protein